MTHDLPPPIPSTPPRVVVPPPTPRWVWWTVGGVAAGLVALLVAGTVFVMGNTDFLYGRDTGNPVGTTLERWLDGGSDTDLGELLDGLEDSDRAVADDRRDVYEMSRVVKKLSASSGAGAAADLARVAALILYTESDPACSAFDTLVAPPLRDWIDAIDEPDGAAASAALSGMSTMAWNITPGIGKRAAELALEGFATGDEGWWSVFSMMEPGEPTFARMMEEFAETPPSGAAGRALLGRTVRVMLDETWDGANPFASQAGVERLRIWLSQEDEASFNSAVAIAFLSDEHRAALLPLGLAHPDAEVQLEAAWAELEAGGESADRSAIDRLIDGCHNIEEATTSIHYLTTTGHGDALPAMAKDPDWVAEARMVNWLMHPNELGAAPEAVGIFDSRELVWPPEVGDGVAPEPERITIFAFTYSVGDGRETAESYGFVHAGQAWSSFTNYDTTPSAETLYAEQCALELTWAQEDEDGDTEDVTPERALELLRAANPGMF